jgi:NAD(P)H-nitrite reductase large subunit
VIVCICANVTEQELIAVIDDGARSVKAVGRRCGAGAGCGECKPLIREQLRQCQAARTAEVASDLSGLASPELAPA